MLLPSVPVVWLSDSTMIRSRKSLQDVVTDIGWDRIGLRPGNGSNLFYALTLINYNCELQTLVNLFIKNDRFPFSLTLLPSDFSISFDWRKFSLSQCGNLAPSSWSFTGSLFRSFFRFFIRFRKDLNDFFMLNGTPSFGKFWSASISLRNQDIRRDWCVEILVKASKWLNNEVSWLKISKYF